MKFLKKLLKIFTPPPLPEQMIVGEINITNGKLWCGDLFLMNEEDGVSVDLPNGTYIAECRLMPDVSRPVPVTLTVKPDTNLNLPVGEPLGEISIDSGNAAVCDMASLNLATGTQHDDFQDKLEALELDIMGDVTFHLEGKISLLYATA